MIKLDELLTTLCPHGVPYVPISEMGTLTRGKRFVHADAVDEGIPCVHYGELYTYYGISTAEARSHIRQELAPKLRYAKKNDVIIVGAGENDTDIGIAVAYLGDEKVAVHDACYIFRQNNDPKYISYCLRTYDYHAQIKKYVSSGKICAISAEGLGKARLPIPPIEIQKRIVEILDMFTELTSLLKEELTLRTKQYDYYASRILDTNNHNIWGDPKRIEYKSIKDVYTRLKGTPITAGKMKEIDNPIGDVRIFAGGKTVVTALEDDIPNANVTRVPSVLVQSRGVIDFIYYERPFTFKNEMWAYTAENKIEVKYLYYILKNNVKRFRELASGTGSLPQISLPVTENYKIPVPPFEVQKRIVEALDSFDELCNSDEYGLLAEIIVHQQQYDYYRDKLLKFKEAI